ncbi:MAG: hypothetical protein BroJett025_11090 [Patescibacteria group bacterium]|nr:MAG: hypothetical protein BroJett025_11090 [Patescibacteria group bacterium]
MAATQQQIDSTTQQFLDIYDITNDLVILKDGTASLVITVDAMNFGLLAEEEQDSIMYAYAGLLNSLNYPIQIVIKSQTKDVTGYLRLLKEQEDTALNRVQQQRIMKYREFVSNLIRERNVLDKKFYVAIPARPLELGLVPVSSVIPGQSQTDISTVDKSMVIEKARSILEPKRDHLIAQFARIGLYSRQIETQEIIQLFYQSYNPEAFEGQSMDDSKSYTAPLVSASIEDVTMNTPNPLDQTGQVAPAQPTQITQTPLAPAEESMQPPVAEIPVVTQTQTTSYVPTQMQNPQVEEPTLEAPVTNTTTTTINPVVPSTPATPLPPTPELPKISPGQVDASVPQEIEIEIKHSGNNTQTSPTPQVTMTPVPETGSINTANTPPQSDAAMPPLPEIQ